MANTTLNDRALLRLSGEDVRGFLQGLVTNDVSGNLPVWAALLTPQGKVLFDFLIWGDRDDILIDCERAASEALVKRLTLYRLRRAITIAPEPGLSGGLSDGLRLWSCWAEAAQACQSAPDPAQTIPSSQFHSLLPG